MFYNKKGTRDFEVYLEQTFFYAAISYKLIFPWTENKLRYLLAT